MGTHPKHNVLIVSYPKGQTQLPHNKGKNRHPGICHCCENQVTGHVNIVLWVRKHQPSQNINTSFKPISNARLISDLIHACTLPSQLAMVKVKGHDSDEKEERKGTTLADEVPKWAAREGSPCPFTSTMFVNTLTPTITVLKVLHRSPTPDDLWSPGLQRNVLSMTSSPTQ